MQTVFGGCMRFVSFGLIAAFVYMLVIPHLHSEFHYTFNTIQIRNVHMSESQIKTTLEPEDFNISVVIE